MAKALGGQRRRGPALIAIGLFLLGTVSAAATEDAPPPPAFPTADFAPGARSAEVTASGLTARITYQQRPKLDRVNAVPVLEVSAAGRPLIEIAGVASGMSEPAATASIARIDADRPGAQVYFSSYSGGAHCCSRISVAEQGPSGSRGGWVAIPVGTFDGDGDYLEDLDKDGIAEIVTMDDAFLYAFDCYACSAAPLVIHAIRDGKVVDVSAEPRFLKANRAWLAELEAGADPATRWTSQGFLAGWVAASIRAGSGPAAWKALETHWNAATDAGEETCLSRDEVEGCPKADLRVLKFPERLKLFLARHGYPV